MVDSVSITHMCRFHGDEIATERVCVCACVCVYMSVGVGVGLGVCGRLSQRCVVCVCTYIRTYKQTHIRAYV